LAFACHDVWTCAELCRLAEEFLRRAEELEGSATG
jgi:hypothetical protein